MAALCCQLVSDFDVMLVSHALTTSLSEGMHGLSIQHSVALSIGGPCIVGSDVFKDVGSRLCFGLCLCE